MDRIDIEPEKEINYYGCNPIELRHPHLNDQLILEYWSEPPFGDPLYLLQLNHHYAGGANGEFHIWARSIFFSSDMNHMIACRGLNNIKLFCIDLKNKKYTDIDDYSLIDKLSGDNLTVRTYRKQKSEPSRLDSQNLSLQQLTNWLDMTFS